MNLLALLLVDSIPGLDGFFLVKLFGQLKLGEFNDLVRWICLGASPVKRLRVLYHGFACSEIYPVINLFHTKLSVKTLRLQVPLLLEPVVSWTLVHWV